MSKKKINPVPVFFGFDERFKPYAYVAISSLVKNCDPGRTYDIHLLHTDLTEETIKTFKTLENDYIKIIADDVSDVVNDIVANLPIRDYYSASTYFRIVIADKFPQYDKALYIDSDTCIVGDVSELFDTKLKKKLVGGVRDAVTKIKPAGMYAKKVIGVKAKRYFNAGVILINSKQWRKEKLLDQFVALASFYDFTVAQDQDYLNVLCRHRVKRLKRRWNMEALHTWKIKEKKHGIIHYAFCAKPWHDNTVPYANYFWEYAKGTPYFMDIKKVFSEHTMEQLEQDNKVGEKVFEACIEEVNRDDNYMKRKKALGASANDKNKEAEDSARENT